MRRFTARAPFKREISKGTSGQASYDEAFTIICTGLPLTDPSVIASGWVKWVGPSAQSSIGPVSAIDEAGEWTVSSTSPGSITEVSASGASLSSFTGITGIPSLVDLDLSDNPDLDVDSLVDEIYAVYESYPDLVVDIGGTCPMVNATSQAKIEEMDGGSGNWTHVEYVAPFEQWRKESDDSTLAILSTGHTDVDFAWLCSGGVYVQGYAAESLDEGPADDPTVLKQCGVASPASASELVGWTWSDLTGSACDSTSFADIGGSLRWSNISGGTGTATITGGKMVLSSIGGVQGTSVPNVKSKTSPAQSGDWLCSYTVEMSGGNNAYDVGLPLPGLVWCQVVFDLPNDKVQIRYNSGYTDTGYKVSDFTGPYSVITQRVGTTVSVSVNGTQVWSTTDAATSSDEVEAYVYNYIGSTGTKVVSISNIVMQGAGGVELYRLPDGVACT